MGLFDFLKPKKIPINEILEKFTNSVFPKGEKDINAGAVELLHILNNNIDFALAKSIFLKAVAISRIEEMFDKERLQSHLAGYCLQYFNDNQIDKFYDYLVALAAAMRLHRRTPSEVRREDNIYVW